MRTTLLLATIALLGVCSAATQSMPRLVPGHIPHLAVPVKPIGTLDPQQPLDITFALSLRNSTELENLIQRLYDPASAEFRHYLTPNEFAVGYGPTLETYERLIAFSRVHRLEIVATHPNRTLLHVRGKVMDIERALSIRLMRFQHPTEARIFFAPVAEPSFDADLPVIHVYGLDDYQPLRPPSAGSAASGNFMSADLRAAYAPGVTLNGAGQKVGIYRPPHGFLQSDISSYQDRSGISPHVPVTSVLEDGGSEPAFANNNFSVEVTLDIEMAIAMAPGLSEVIVYEDNGNVVDALNRMATDNSAKQLSSSWPPPPQDPGADQIYKQFAVQGQTFFSASADDGAYYSILRASPNEVPQWADDPNITIVGGTVLTTLGPVGAWQSEMAWSQSGGGWQQGKGGASKESDYPSIPAWQKGLSWSNNLGSALYRNSPDVAMVAQSLFIFFNGADGGANGTSASAPLWAGFVALANQQAANVARPSLGFANPFIYAMGNSSHYTDYFHDIQAGNNVTKWNTQPGGQNMYPATIGYDLVTGWGTPKGINLINALATRSVAAAPHVTVVLMSPPPCQPFPLAGEPATFIAKVSDGIPPFSYDWIISDANWLPGESHTLDHATVIAPPAGATIVATVNVRDSLGSTNTASLPAVSHDPAFAAKEASICQIISSLDRFKPPIYVNPGDPGPIEKWEADYSLRDVVEIEKAAQRLTEEARKLQRVIPRSSATGKPAVEH
jgi:subtilase family serine protease